MSCCSAHTPIPNALADSTRRTAATCLLPCEHVQSAAAEEAKRKALAAQQELLRAGLEAQRAEAAARKAKDAKVIEI